MESQTSYIESQEEMEASKLVESLLGFPLPEAKLDRILVKIYVRPEDLFEVEDIDGNKKAIYLPETMLATDKFRNATALVIAVGPHAYANEDYEDTGPGCKVGDWVFMPRNAGQQMNYRGVPLQQIMARDLWMTLPGPDWADKAEEF